jgi:hypothetical protein
MEVNSTEPSPSERLPWFIALTRIYGNVSIVWQDSKLPPPSPLRPEAAQPEDHKVLHQEVRLQLRHEGRGLLGGDEEGSRGRVSCQSR